MHLNSQAIVQALTEFTNSRGPDTRISVVTYGKTSTVQMPLTAISDDTRHQINDILRRLDFRGQVTDTSTGLHQALSEFINHGGFGAQRSIILITNDVANLGDEAANKSKTSWVLQAQMPTAVYNHVRIYAVTFNNTNVFKTLQVLALGTGGNAYQAKAGTDLSGIFQRISANMLNTNGTSMLITPLQMTPSVTGSSTILSKFNTPLTHRKSRTLSTPWLWLIGLLVLVAAFIGIYAAWNIVRHVRIPKNPVKPLSLYGEGPRAVLYDISNPNDIKRYELAERSTLLGRVAGYDPEVQYILVKEKTVGRCHAVIERRGHSFWIMDQGSINGTFVNGERITADRALKHGDIVAIHRHEFEFMIPEYFESESTVVGVREQLAG
ncbi:MAG: FHA domain-containing protein [Gammaproteobacteria bacterium]|nr:FHA domain-containing protein [Gammaproteobacteria bacterium]